MDNSENSIWERLHAGNYVFEPNCWQTCSGFCCANGHKDFDFSFFPKGDGTTILYMGPEYDWMLKNRVVPRDANGVELATKKSFDFGGPKPISYAHAPCKLLGRCDGVLDKPFLCKIYPFFPVLSLRGELEDVCPSSIFELTFALRKDKTPCTVFSKKEKYLKDWQTHPEALAALRNPTVIFYLRAAKHFANNYTASLSDNRVLRELTGKPFWKAWEIQYLSGKLVDSASLKVQLKKDYDDMVSLYGEFEI